MGKNTLSVGGTYYTTRAVYFPSPDGLKLARVEAFNVPRFRPLGWEDERSTAARKDEGAQAREDAASEDADKNRPNCQRAIRRAKTNAFDAIMCNPDIDLFATLTYSPEQVEDKADYNECYRYLNTFFSNRVQRRGLKYICAPERTKKGDVHFHFLCNSTAMKLVEAVSPKTGRVLTHGKKILYNLPEWTRGFSSAEYITEGGENRDAVAKYIFKYIGKDAENKVGGRYLLTGGELARPVYAYGDSPTEFIQEGVEKYHKTVLLEDAGIKYDCYSMI